MTAWNFWPPIATSAGCARSSPKFAPTSSPARAFADALGRYPKLFPPMYVALVRVGEASGSLDQVLEVLADERMRAEAVRRKLTEAMRYPAFIFVAAACVLMFFLTFVLPQFASVLHDFGAKIDPTLAMFLALSAFLRANIDAIGIGLVADADRHLAVAAAAAVRAAMLAAFTRLPLVRRVMPYYRAPLFCRNLGVLLGSGVHLTTALRILVDIMAATGPARYLERDGRPGAPWGETVRSARRIATHCRRWRYECCGSATKPGNCRCLAGRVAEFYEAKLQRGLDRLVGIAGPAAIIAISIVVGGLIVSVMTALVSVSQIVG